jgi:predicted amidophosphoribosyltransferase
MTAPYRSLCTSANRHDLFTSIIILFDDLYRSGETLGEITRTLMSKGKIDRVYVLTITRTRSLR